MAGEKVLEALARGLKHPSLKVRSLCREALGSKTANDQHRVMNDSCKGLQVAVVLLGLLVLRFYYLIIDILRYVHAYTTFSQGCPLSLRFSVSQFCFPYVHHSSAIIEWIADVVVSHCFAGIKP